MRRSIVALGLLTLLLSPSAPSSGAPVDDLQGAYAQVDLVFVLDTTGSMSGMIAATKQKIWSIVSALTEIDSETEIRLGFVAYRDRKDAYVTRRVPLTRDIDAAYVQLMGFEAGGGGDTPESVNQALDEAVNLFQWSRTPGTLRVIFLVGDAPPHMDYSNDVPYPQSCALAARMEIRIHTIQCAANPHTRRIWREIATCARGDYFAIARPGSRQPIKTPFDWQLALHARLLDKTILPYGSEQQQEAQRKQLEASRTIDKEAPAEAKAERARFRARTGSLVAEGDLVSDVQSGATDLASVPEERLPSELRQIPAERRRQYVDDLFQQRRGLQSEIEWFSVERDKYIKDQYSGRDDSLDRRVLRSLLESRDDESEGEDGRD